jgi:hypothetical protein
MGFLGIFFIMAGILFSPSNYLRFGTGFLLLSSSNLITELLPRCGFLESPGKLRVRCVFGPFFFLLALPGILFSPFLT